MPASRSHAWAGVIEMDHDRPSGVRQGFTFSLSSGPLPEIKRKVEERVTDKFHHTSTGQQAFRWWPWSVRDSQE